MSDDVEMSPEERLRYWRARAEAAENRETALMVKCARYQDVLLNIAFETLTINPRKQAEAVLSFPTKA